MAERPLVCVCFTNRSLVRVLTPNSSGEGAIAAPLKLVAKGPVIVAGKPNQPLLDAVLVR